MTTQPTPTPWRLSKLDPHSVVAGPNGTVVAECPGYKGPREANAALIVRAVNSHEALVTALENARRLLSGEARKDRRAGEMWNVWMAECAERAEAALANARRGA